MDKKYKYAKDFLDVSKEHVRREIEEYVVTKSSSFRDLIISDFSYGKTVGEC